MANTKTTDLILSDLRGYDIEELTALQLQRRLGLGARDVADALCALMDRGAVTARTRGPRSGRKVRAYRALA